MIKSIATSFGIEPAAIACFVEVETGGLGFGADGKIVIQFDLLSHSTLLSLNYAVRVGLDIFRELNNNIIDYVNKI